MGKTSQKDGGKGHGEIEIRTTLDVFQSGEMAENRKNLIFRIGLIVYLV